MATRREFLIAAVLPVVLSPITARALANTDWQDSGTDEFPEEEEPPLIR
jgi:hypothetical protein